MSGYCFLFSVNFYNFGNKNVEIFINIKYNFKSCSKKSEIVNAFFRKLTYYFIISFITQSICKYKGAWAPVQTRVAVVLV